MGQLVFARLFYHHMAGQLAGQQEFKNRLFTYLEGSWNLWPINYTENEMILQKLEL